MHNHNCIDVPDHSEGPHLCECGVMWRGDHPITITDELATVVSQHGPECEGPDEDGDWSCPISSKEPGLCPNCLHNWGIERQMTLADTAPERIWYLCYTCGHGC